MSSRVKYRHPEIDVSEHATLKALFEDHNSQDHKSPVKTLVDVLEIGTDLHDGKVNHKNFPALSHDDLVLYFEKAKEEERKAPLRIIFLKDTELEPSAAKLGASFDNRQVSLEYETIDYLINTIGVSPLFMSTLTTVEPQLSTPNALFKTYGPNRGRRQQPWRSVTSPLHCVRGFFSAGHEHSQVWFQHDILRRTSTYIIHGCPDFVKQTLQSSADTTAADGLFRPLALEAMILDQASWRWSKSINIAYRHLYACEIVPHQHSFRFDDTLDSIHDVDQFLRVLRDEMRGMVEQLDFLLQVHKTLENASFHTRPEAPPEELIGEDKAYDFTSTADTLRFLRLRTHNWSRWLNNWQERVEIRVNQILYLAAKRDTDTNLTIAQLTARIARETHRDSSSMMTIAILTLFFLPGTFVTGIFSMPLMQTALEDTHVTWKVYIGVSFTLTFVVGIVWNWWCHYRNTQQEPFPVFGYDGRLSQYQQEDEGFPWNWWRRYKDKKEEAAREKQQEAYWKEQQEAGWIDQTDESLTQHQEKADPQRPTPPDADGLENLVTSSRRMSQYDLAEDAENRSTCQIKVASRPPIIASSAAPSDLPFPSHFATKLQRETFARTLSDGLSQASPITLRASRRSSNSRASHTPSLASFEDRDGNNAHRPSYDGFGQV